MSEWDYKTTKDFDEVYADICNVNQINPYKYSIMTDEEREITVNNILKKIRKINVFPIIYYNDNGIENEIKKFIAKEATMNSSSICNDLLNFLFPNIHRVMSSSAFDCIYDRFYNDERLKKIIHYYLKGYPLYSVKTMFFMSSKFLWSTPTNFLPLRAKAIYEKYCAPGAIIYDYSCGFGGRMLGALGSKNNYTYIGCEPCKETYENLLKLGTYIEKITHRNNSYKIYNNVSEELKLDQCSIDFAFSCPPYYKKEKYSNEITQCTNKYKMFEDWLENYVRPTVKNCHYMLKNKGLYGIVISNCSYAGRDYPIKDRWLKILNEEGFTFVEQIDLGMKHSRKNDCESLYIYKKED